MRVRPSLIAAASIAAAMNRLGLAIVTENGPSCKTAASTSEILLSTLVGADVTEIASLVRSVETLMTAQLASVQQQQQQQQQQQEQHHIQHQNHLKNSKLQQQQQQQQTTTNWELDVQPETPTDIQDIHF